MNKFLSGLRAGLKAFTMAFSTRASSWYSTWLGSTHLNYAGQVGDGRGNAIVRAVVEWECRTFPEAPIRIMRRAGEEEEPVPDHPLLLLLRHPNPFYGGVTLWSATIADWLTTGNAYWIKQRSAGERVVRLWWAPAWSMEPQWPDNDTSVFISHYKYTPGTKPMEIPPENVVHFRFGMDPDNVRRGLSPLGALAREIFTDNEAANWTAALLHNGALPQIVVSPGDKDAEFDNPDEIKTTFTQNFGGDNRGGVVVMNGMTTVEPLGFNPQQMDLKALRRIPEERVTAIFGVPAVIVGLGAGLDRSTYNNMSEAREHAYEGVIIPHQRMFAEQLETQLLADFDDINRASVAFDYSEIRVLQEDVNNLHARARENLMKGLTTLNQSLAMIGEEQLPSPAGDVRYIPISVTPTPVDALIPEEPEPEAPADEEEEAEPEVRGPVRAVASRTLLPDRKAPSQFGPAVLRLRTQLVRANTTAIADFLEDQRDRVLAALTTAMKDVADEVFDDNAEAEQLRLLLEPWYSRALSGVVGLTQEALSITFELDDPLVRAYLREAGTEIRNISLTTQKAVRRALTAGQQEGESYQQLAARIRNLPEFNRNRARLVARTELGSATNRATITSFEASRVVAGIQVTDGTDWDDECRAINGRRFSLLEARTVPMLAHPNCTRAFSPLTDVQELRSATGNGHVPEQALASAK